MRHASRVAWAGLASSNPELSTNFYLSLFGWGSYDIPLKGIGTLTMFTLGAEDVALAYRQTRQARDARVVPHWTLFISVEDTDRALSRAAASGATILRGLFLVADAAEVTAVRDPTGAIISLWQPLNRQRAANRQPCWFCLLE
jgi:predicted enzyme related to lactoylglutathione lyase